MPEGHDISEYPDYEMADVDVLGALTDLTKFLKGETVEDSVYVD